MIRLYGENKPSTINDPANVPIGTYHLTDNPALYEPQRSNNFELIITGLEGLSRPGSNIGFDNGVDNVQEVLRLSVNSSFVPNFTLQPITINRGNSSFKVVGTPTFPSGQVAFKDFIGADTCGILQAWYSMGYNVNTEKGGLMSDYKKKAYLIAYTPDHQKVRQWVMEGVFISNLQIPEFSNDSQNTQRLITATFEYDRAKEDITEWLE